MSDVEVNEQQQAVEEVEVDLFDVKEGQPDPLADEQTDKQESLDANENDASGAEEVIPDKYRGKSLNEVIEMHQNAEKHAGRLGNEVGELRKLTDEILKRQLESAANPAGNESAQKVSADDLMENPDQAISKVVSTDPKVREIEAKLVARERADQLAVLKTQHPDAETLAQDPKFGEWVAASPARVRMFQQADQNFDYELAGELFTLYKAGRAMTEAERAQAEEQREHDKAGLKAPRSSSGSNGQRVKVFKRADLMRLKIEDPTRYERMQPEILQAYAEGRVR